MRVDAATRCPKCSHTWRISASHFHQVTSADDGLTPEPTIDKDPPKEDPRTGSSVTGMSGLSDLMQAEPNRSPGDSAVGGPPPPIQEAKFASPEAARKLTEAAADLKAAAQPGTMSRQSRRLAILIIALLAFGVALAGIGIVTLGSDKNSASPSAGSETPTAPDAIDPLDLPENTQEDPAAPLLDNAGPPARPDLDPDGAG